MSGDTPLRKIDHLRLAADRDVEHRGSTLLENVVLEHMAAPELDLDDVDLSITFLGKRVRAPLMVTGMTGGHPLTASINCSIAEAVEELGLAMGVGSQRAALENPDTRVVESFKAARKCAPTAPIIANIGMAQLASGLSVEALEKLIEMVEADAIAVHLNVGQELAQPEGDRRFKGFIERLAEVVESLSRPVIVKETGHGISGRLAYRLSSVGVRYFDVSGAGGTSWIRVEAYRLKARGLEAEAKAAEQLSDWGVPTALSIMEVRWAAPASCVIASGGIRTGLDAARAIALGADLAGVALPVLRAYVESGLKGVRTLLESMVNAMKAAALMAGAKRVEELRRLPILLLEPLRSLAAGRGIDLELYMWVRSSYLHRC